MKTIGHRWPASAPKGDFAVHCDYCNTRWRRSQLRRDAAGLLVCPDEGPGRDAVTLARGNAASAKQNRGLPPQRDGGLYANTDNGIQALTRDDLNTWKTTSTTTVGEWRDSTATDYYQVAESVPFAFTEATFVVALRVESFLTSTGNIFSDGVVGVGGFAMSCVGTGSTYRPNFTFVTDAGTYTISAVTDGAPLEGKLTVVSCRATSGGLWETRLNGLVIAQGTLPGTQVPTSAALMRVGRGQGTGPVTDTGIVGIGMLRRSITDGELDAVRGNLVRAGKLSDAGLNNDRWEILYSPPDYAGAPAGVRNLGSLGGVANLIRQGQGPTYAESAIT